MQPLLLEPSCCEYNSVPDQISNTRLWNQAQLACDGLKVMFCMKALVCRWWSTGPPHHGPVRCFEFLVRARSVMAHLWPNHAQGTKHGQVQQANR